MMTKQEFIIKNSSYPLHSPLYLEAPLAVGLCQHSALRSTTGNPSCLLPLGCTMLFPPHVLPHTLFLVRSNDIEQGHSFPCKNPLPLADNTFISLTLRNGISLHVPSCLIAIGGYIPCVLYPAPKFPAGINKVHLFICHRSKPYILTNALEINNDIKLSCPVFCGQLIFFILENLQEKGK